MQLRCSSFQPDICESAGEVKHFCCVYVQAEVGGNSDRRGLNSAQLHAYEDWTSKHGSPKLP